MKKTLQDQYLLIKEGKGHKGVFLTEAKRQFPDIIRTAASFDEAVASLITKNIISENVIGLTAVAGFEPRKKETYETAFEKFLAEAKKKENEDEKVKAEEKKVSKPVEEDLEKQYDKTDDKNPDNLIFDQIMMGYYVEMKDPKNADKTMQQLKDIVLKNLAKDPIYYTKDGQFGVKGLGYTTEAPGLGTPKEAKGKHKSSGYGDLNEGVMYGDSDGDRDADMESTIQANEYYDKGLEAYNEGDKLKAEKYYQAALKAGSWLGWTENDLPPYNTVTESIGRNYPGELEGEYEGELQKIYGADIYDTLKDVLDISNSEDDFIRKMTMSLTDETNILPKSSKEKLRTWYQKNSSGLGENLDKFKSDVRKGFTQSSKEKPSDEDIKAKLKQKREAELKRRKEAGEPLEEITLRKVIREIIDEELNRGSYYEEVIQANDFDEDTAYAWLEDQGLSTMEINSIITNIFGNDLEEVRGGGNYGMMTINTRGGGGGGKRFIPKQLPFPLNIRKRFGDHMVYNPGNNTFYISDILYNNLVKGYANQPAIKKLIMDIPQMVKQILNKPDNYGPTVELPKEFKVYHPLNAEVEKAKEDKFNKDGTKQYWSEGDFLFPNLNVMEEGGESLMESVEKDLADINKEAEHEILQSKLDKIDVLIDKRKSQLGKLDEDEDMKALTDKKKVKELEKDIKKLEQAKSKVEKMISKSKGKKSTSKEVIDEIENEPSEEYLQYKEDAESRYEEGQDIDSILNGYNNIPLDMKDMLRNDLEAKFEGTDNE